MANALCLKSLYMPIRRVEKLFHYIFGSDLDFYEEYLMDLPDDEQEKFFDAKVFSCGPGCGIIFKTD